MLVAPFILGSLGPHAPPPSGGFPGQPGNPVGFAHAPGFTSLTTFSGTLTSGTSGAHQVYSFKDFIPSGTNSTVVDSLSYIDFIGCRFQSNATGESNAGSAVVVGGSDHITFTYCSFTPKASLYTSPPGGAWPSAGSYPNTPSPLTFTTDVNCINGNDGYQYGCNVNDTGPVSWDHCDFWGFGQNGPGFFSTTAQMIVNECWIHDACNQSPLDYHTDGLGYQNSGTGPNNVSITGCTIASLGNSNGIAWQQATAGYDNIIMTGNYISGYGNMIALGLAGNTFGLSNSTFSNNVIGTDVQWWDALLYNDYTAMFSGSGNTWSNNTLNVVPGSINWPGGHPYGDTGDPDSASTPTFSSADDGKFVWPDATLHATDF